MIRGAADKYNMSSLSQLIQQNLSSRQDVEDRDNSITVEAVVQAKISTKKTSKFPRQSKMQATESGTLDPIKSSPATSAAAAALMRPHCHVIGRRPRS